MTKLSDIGLDRMNEDCDLQRELIEATKKRLGYYDKEKHTCSNCKHGTLAEDSKGTSIMCTISNICPFKTQQYNSCNFYELDESQA